MGFLNKAIGIVTKPVAGLLGMGGGGGYQGYAADTTPIRHADAPLPVAAALTPEQGLNAFRNNLMMMRGRHTPEEQSMNALAGRYAPGQRSIYDMWLRNYGGNTGQNIYGPSFLGNAPPPQAAPQPSPVVGTIVNGNQPQQVDVMNALRNFNLSNYKF